MQYNLHCKITTEVKPFDIILFNIIDQGPRLKLKYKDLGQNKVTKIKTNKTYDIEKIAPTEGQMNTITCAEYMKPWLEENYIFNLLS